MGWLVIGTKSVLGEGAGGVVGRVMVVDSDLEMGHRVGWEVGGKSTGGNGRAHGGATLVRGIRNGVGCGRA